MTHFLHRNLAMIVNVNDLSVLQPCYDTSVINSVYWRHKIMYPLTEYDNAISELSLFYAIVEAILKMA